MAIKLSNVIGAPFSQYILEQLYLRAEKNSSITRSNDEVLFLANKTAWARLISSVNISLKGDALTKFYGDLKIAVPSTSEALAKNWILEAGTSIQNGNGITLRQGIGLDGAYGLGGTEELGYRPMPGLTSVQIETTGRLGSLRQATINFKVWNMDQLNIIEALYFRLGYSMLIEWGHTQYYSNKTKTLQTDGIYGIDDPFGQNLRKEDIQQAIAKKAKTTFGNYDGMLGIVSNFTWAFNQEGGYDCTVRLVGLGAIMDSMRINQAYTLPNGLIQEYKKNKQALNAAEIAAIAKKAVDDEYDRRKSADQKQSPTEVINNVQALNDFATKYDGVTDIVAFDKEHAYYKASAPNYTLQTANLLSPDIYYLPTGLSGDTADYKTNLKNQYGGIYRISSTGDTFSNFIPYNASAVSIDIGELGSAAEAAIATYSDYNPSTEHPYSWAIQKVFDVQNTTALSKKGLDLIISSTADTSKLDNGTKARINYYPNGFSNSPNVQIPEVKDPNQSPFRRDLNKLLGTSNKEFYFDITYNLVSQNPDQYYPYKYQVIEALGTWFDGYNFSRTYEASDSRTITNISIDTEGTRNDKSIVVTGKSRVTVKNVPYRGVGPSNQTSTFQDVVIEFTFTTNDTGLLLQATRAPQIQPLINQQGTSATGDNGGTVNQSTNGQTDAAEGFASALDAMLTIVQAKGQSEALGVDTLKAVNLFHDTDLFYRDGSLNGVLTTTTGSINSTTQATLNQLKSAGVAAGATRTAVPFDLVKYAQKGFNSNLFVDPTLYYDIPDVNFSKLCYAYAIKYPQINPDGSSDQLHSPVYIQLGYLLAFLNNMCLIYDSTQEATTVTKTDGTQKRPYVYIDFNPETNFCLTSPQQFSIDPQVCLIPCNVNDDQFNALFPPSVNTKIFDPKLFSPTTTNKVTQLLNNNSTSGLVYKHDGNNFQGRTMSILLNTQYLLDQVRGFAGSDAAHAVNLQSFLEKIMLDVNKAMGNINSFRVAYRDDTNTIQIQDDQWVPSIGGEASLMTRSSYIDSLQRNKVISGLLPIFNTNANTLSMVRQFQLKTTLSTKLASMIAISAQASTGSVNATDHSQLSYLNQHYQDRYKKHIQDPSNGASGNNTNTKSNSKDLSNDQKLAQLFNDHVSGIYGNINNYSVDKVESAKNYYIERMSKIKSGDPITTAAPFIPADLEITLDGISGIIMGNAFTIPENRLPLSLKGENGFTKVAFIVTGLTHTIAENEWLTRIKGQMIKLRESTKYGVFQQITSTQVVPATTANPASTGFNKTIDEVPWSAAFISYVMNQAGVNFPSSDAHTRYAQALRTNQSYGFQILDPKGTVLQPGDIVIQNRGNSLTFYSNPWSGDSHGDIVVSINGNSAAVIGGNVSSKVALTNLALSNGTLGSPNYFVVLRPPQNSANKIVSAANAEYKLWKSNNWTEQTPAARATLAAYYKIVGITI